MDYHILASFLVFGIQILHIGQSQQCIPGRLYPEPQTGCRQFRICDPDGRYSQALDCAEGTLFDNWKQECEHDYKVRCADTQSPADCREGPLLEHNCKVFIRCDFGRQHYIRCPNRTVYSRENRVCAWPFFLSTAERQACGLFGRFV